MKLINNLKIELKSVQLLFPRRDRIVFAVFVGLFSAIVILFPALTGILDRMLLDLKCRIHTRFINSDFSSDTLILAVDSQTLRSAPYKWPWPQDYWAEVLANIQKKLEPEMVLFDIYFQENEKDSLSQKFVEEIHRGGNVGLVAVFEEHFSEKGQQLEVFPPIEGLANAARFWGMSQFPIDSDGMIRSFLLYDFRLEKMHVAWEACRNFADFKADSSGFEGLKTARSILTFKHEERRIPQVPICKVLQENFEHPRLKKKIVVIGATAPILHDYHQTPTGIVAGPELIGNSIDSVRHGRLQFLDDSWSSRFGYYLGGFFLALIPFLDFVKRRWLWVLGELVCLPPLLFAFSFLPSVHPPVVLTFISYLVFQTLVMVIFRISELNLIHQSLHEAEICGKIQKKFFPADVLRLPGGFSAAGRCIPFQNAGGDYYDFFANKDGRVFFFLGDVAGHGISASMLTTAAKSVVLINSAKDGFAIQDLLLDMNSAILNLINKRMMSAVSGTVDFAANKITLFSAGHLPAVLKTPEGIQELKIAGLPLGVSKRFLLKDSLEIPVPQQGKLVVYSDGIVEAVNWENEQLGFDRFYEALEKMPMTLSGEQTLDYIYQMLDQHVCGRAYQDDVTVLVLSFNSGEAQ
jgi:CHASE2 domain-containing sensor protein